MANDPDYYRLLGVEPTADQATIDAAYQGRSLRFRLGQLRDRAQAMSGPTQEEIEQAHAVLGNPEARALYDAAYFPDKRGRGRRRMPLWVWGIATIWIVAIAAVCVVGARSKLVSDGGAIGRVVATVTATITATSPPVVAVASPALGTPAPPTATQAPAPAAATRPSPQAATSAAPPVATATATTTAPPTPTATLAPTPSAAATAIPPTSTTAPPTMTPVPPTVPPPATAPPPPPPTEAPPAPTPTAVFAATDRIGTTVPVNLRSGPGTNNASLGALPPGTLLIATGETANAGGYLWRRFQVQDGRVGWVRDIDVTAVR